jgi:N-acetylneuraminic acid mutarotase
MVAGAIDGRIYIVGGRDSTIEVHSARMDIYDPATDTWSSGASMPTSRSGMAGAVLGDFLFVAGGEGNDAVESGVFAVVEVYDPATDTWTEVEPMPTPRHGTHAAVLDNTIYIPGGADVQGGGAVATHEAWVLE